MNVVTITLNPAIDLTGNLSELQPGEVNLVADSSRRAAGKGINVASVLAQLGEQVTATGFLGADNCEEFEHLFEAQQITDAFVRVPGNTRVNVKLAENSGRVSDVNFPGFFVSQAAQQELLSQLEVIVKSGSLVVVAGSLPKGVEPAYITQLIQVIKAAGGRVLLDTSGEALKAGLAAGPELAKPNIEELSAVVGRELSFEELPHIAAELMPGEEQILVVSAGSDGLYMFGKLGQHHCLPPRVTVASTVGAGDTLVAGLTQMLLNQSPLESGLRRACALSAFAVTQHGITIPEPAQLSALEAQVAFSQ